MTLRDQFVQMMQQEQKTLDFFEDTGTRHSIAEGFSQFVDVTDQTIAEAKRRIAMYQSLIAKIDGTSDSGG
ncbi:hypothetical protein GOC51_03645 [Sinorhizobium meliloti]|nr:hypothetical protein [Sinorhizobium meliloti]